MNGKQSGTSVYTYINDIDPNFIPTVGKYGENGYTMMVGKYDDNSKFYVVYVIWDESGWLAYSSNQTGYIRQQVSYTTSLSYLDYVMAVCGFNWKNSGLAIQLCATGYSSSWLHSSLYGLPGGLLTDSLSSNMKLSKWGQCLPLQAGGGVLYKMVVMDDLTVGVMYIQSSGSGAIYEYQTTVKVPKRASIFPDSLTYVSAHQLWVCFTGTGILFSRNPTEQKSWGYLDTTDKLGIITQMAGAYYNDAELSLYFYGMTSANVFKMAKLYVGEWFQYATDGAWLPLLSSEGIPAYIKAKSPA